MGEVARNVDVESSARDVLILHPMRVFCAKYFCSRYIDVEKGAAKNMDRYCIRSDLFGDNSGVAEEVAIMNN